MPENQTIDLDEHLTVRQISKSLHVTEETVRCYIRDGELDAVWVGRGWRIHPDDYARFYSRLRKRQVV